MTARDQAHDMALLESALLHGHSSRHASLRELFERRPELRELFEQMHGRTDCDPAWLESLRTTARPVDLPWMRELVAEVSQRRRAEHGSVASSGRRWLRWSLLAAGLLVAAGALFWWQGRAPRSSGSGQMLGPSPGQLEAAERLGLSCSEPKGAVTRFGAFRWHAKHNLSASESYVVRVYAVTGAGAPGELLETGLVRSNEWTPEAQRASAWPARIQWSVSLAEEGFEKAEAWASAERSP